VIYEIFLTFNRKRQSPLRELPLAASRSIAQHRAAVRFNIIDPTFSICLPLDSIETAFNLFRLTGRNLIGKRQSDRKYSRPDSNAELSIGSLEPSLTRRRGTSRSIGVFFFTQRMTNLIIQGIRKYIGNLSLGAFHSTLRASANRECSGETDFDIVK